MSEDNRKIEIDTEKELANWIADIEVRIRALEKKTKDL